MIKLGYWGGHMFPNSGVLLIIQGKLIFKGSVVIGNDSTLKIHNESKVEISDKFLATTSFHLETYHNVIFGEHTIFGWNCIVYDNSFYKIESYGDNFSINIGNDNWFSQQCVISANVHTPPRCIFAACSIICDSDNFESYCVYGGNPLKVLSRNVKLDYDNYMVKEYV